MAQLAVWLQVACWPSPRALATPLTRSLPLARRWSLQQPAQDCLSPEAPCWRTWARHPCRRRRAHLAAARNTPQRRRRQTPCASRARARGWIRPLEEEFLPRPSAELRQWSPLLLPLPVPLLSRQPLQQSRRRSISLWSQRPGLSAEPPAVAQNSSRRSRQSQPHLSFLVVLYLDARLELRLRLAEARA